MIESAQEMEEKRGYLSELKQLTEVNKDSVEVALKYCTGLYNMRVYDVENYVYYISELYRLLSDEKNYKYVSIKEPRIITYTRRELIDYELRMGKSD